MLLARMSGNPDLIIEQDPETIQFGPKMAALSEKRRALVVALFDDDAPSKGDGLLPWAARKAGYGTATSSTRSLGNIAGRIIHDDAVQDGIKEHSHRVMRAIPPEAIRALKALIRNPDHREHMRAIATVLDRTDPLQTLHTVKVEDARPPSPEITAKVLERIDELARRAGLLPPPQTIEGDFEIVESGDPA
jgi:hypothetical protein